MFASIPGIVPLFLIPCTLIFLSCLPFGDPATMPTGLRAYFVDVGQGDACALRTPAGSWILCDVGDDANALIGFLRSVHADTLRAVLLTHPDADHFGALDDVLRTFPVEKVYLPAGNSPSPAWRETLRVLDESAAARETLFTGDTLVWDGVLARVQWPAPSSPFAGNNLSTVLRVDFAGRRILFTGDIEDAAERALLADRADIAADILKVAHHGSRTSSSLDFIEAVRPAWAVISCDSSAFGHPHAEALADLEWVMADSAHILRTDREGTLGFELDGMGIRRIDPYRN